MGMLGDYNMGEQPPQLNQPPIKGILVSLGVVSIALMVVAISVVISQRGDSPTPTLNAPTTGALAIVGDGAYSSGVNVVETKLITDYALTDMNGQPAQLSDLRGKFTVLYFGYTFCPDFCPATLTDYRLIARELGEQAENVNFVLVSVDPQRDTPELLKGYVTRFNSNFLAYTSDLDTLSTMTAEFGAFFESMAVDDNPYYMVNHTASSFVLNPFGEWVTVYAFGTTVDTIVADLMSKLSDES
jgi:protein SCO1/2